MKKLLAFVLVLALALPLFAAPIMEQAGPLLCRFALRSAGETAEETHSKGLG